MSTQKKLTVTTAKPAKAVSMIEPLEGRTMFSASPAPDGVAVMAEQTKAAKVSSNDISIAGKDKASPQLPLRITMTDVLVS